MRSNPLTLPYPTRGRRRRSFEGTKQSKGTNDNQPARLVLAQEYLLTYVSGKQNKNGMESTLQTRLASPRLMLTSICRFARAILIRGREGGGHPDILLGGGGFIPGARVCGVRGGWLA